MATVYDIVNARITDALKNGTVPWRRPWDTVAMDPCNITGRKYSGINFFIASIMPFAVPVYLTARQIREAGGSIKDVEVKRALPIVYWNFSKRINDLGKEETIPFIRFFNVWNVEQCDGIELPESLKPKATDRVHAPIESAAAIIDGMPNRPEMRKGGDRACYFPTKDEIRVPNLAAFHTAEDYYATVFHELGHSTGHTSRLNRKEVMGGNYFGSHDYSLEELVAELTAAYLCYEAGIDNTIPNNAAYIASWLKRLTDDPKMFVTAAGRAQKAANYILNRGANTQEEDA